MFQLVSTLKKNALEKRRNPCISFCEYSCHFLIIVVLILGYGMSKILDFSSAQYFEIDVRVPPVFLHGPDTTTPIKRHEQKHGAPSKWKYFYLGNATYSYDIVYTFYKLWDYLDHAIPIPSLDQYLKANEFLASNAGSSSAFLTQTTVGRKFSTLLYKGTLHFAPNTAVVQDLIDYMNRTSRLFKTRKILTHESEGAAVDYILSNAGREYAMALIALRQITPQKINYVIRQNFSTLPSTKTVILTPARKAFNNQFQMYFTSGFLTLQNTVDNWVFHYTGATQSDHAYCKAPPVDIISFPFPTYKYSQNPFFNSLGFLLGLALTMATVYPMSRLVKSVVEEKETRMRETMKIMGLKEWVHQLSWTIMGCLLFLWIALSTTFLSVTSFLKYSNKVLVFLFFSLFCMSEVAMAFLVSVFFSNSKLAAICGPVVLLFTLLPKFIFFGSDQNDNVAYKVLASFLSPTAYSFGADIIANYEYEYEGVQWSNINSGDYNFATSLGMVFIDTLLYAFLAWYFDQTLPHEFGTPKHPLFFLLPSYWCGYDRNAHRDTLQVSHSIGAAVFVPWRQLELSPSPESSAARSSVRAEDTAGDTAVTSSSVAGWEEGASIVGAEVLCNANITLPDSAVLVGVQSAVIADTSAADNPNIEPLTADEQQHVQVSVRGLRKIFNGGKVAVHNLDFDLVEGQITCLLGHNGAGKSTTISILTGMIQPTLGECFIYGKRLSKSLAAIRSMTGICPQHNVLFPSLTVTEHLKFFGSIKGLIFGRLDAAVNELIRDVGLDEKRHVASSALSGGMKRKLSLAMALIGSPKFVVLDEPTSGMDPYARRAVWELLQRHKRGRVIVLTTHYLEEADIVSDRIIILSEGRMRCAGSSLFLKNRFGAGYVLSVTRIHRDQDVTDVVESEEEDWKVYEEDDPPERVNKVKKRTGANGHVSDHDTKDDLNHSLKSIVPSSFLISEFAGESVFSIPFDMVSRLAEVCSFLKTNATALGVVSYGVSITSLEQVFIRLARESKNEKCIDVSFEDELSAGERLQRKLANVWLQAANIMKMAWSQCFAAFGADRLNKNLFASSPSSPLQNRLQNPASRLSVAHSDSTATAAVDVTLGVNPIHSHMFSDTAEGHARPVKPWVSPPRSRSDDDEEKEPKKRLEDEHSSPHALSTSASLSSSSSLQKAYDSQILHAVAGVTDTDRDAKEERRIDVEDKEDREYGDDLYSTYDKDDIEPVVDSPGSSGRFDVQFFELMRKRFIVARRDLKGFFFQIVFPALQIVAILAILTVNLQSSGPSIKLNAGIFKKFSPVALYAGEVSHPVARSLSTSRMDLHMSPPRCNTSEKLSEYLLDDFPNSHKDRFGAFIFKDSIPVNLTIDWRWTVDFVHNFAVEYPDETNRILEYYVSPSHPLVFNLPNWFLANRTVSLSFLNIDTSGLDGDATKLTKRVLDALNVTTPGFNVTALAGIFNIKLSMSNVSEFTLKQSITGSLSFGGVKYLPDKDALTLNDVTLTADSRIFHAPSASLTYAQIRAGVYEFTNKPFYHYRLSMPSPYTVMHNMTAPHSVAAFMGELKSSYFASCSPAVYPFKPETPEPIYYAKNHPLPLTVTQTIENQILLSFLACLFILIPLCYIPAAFVSFIVKERASKAKHIQMVSSVRPVCYWVATYAWDVSLYTLLAVFVMSAFFMYGQNSAQVFISSSVSAGAVFLLLWSYGLSILPLCYIYSLAFTNHSTCQITVTVINFTTGFIFVMAYYIMTHIPETADAGEQMVGFFRCFPTFNVGEGLIAVTVGTYQNELLHTHYNFLSYDFAGRNICYMFIQAVCFFCILLITESRTLTSFLRMLNDKRVAMVADAVDGVDNGGDGTALTSASVAGSVAGSVDVDVLSEAKFVESLLLSNTQASGDTGHNNPSKLSQYILILDCLTKTYPPTVFLGSAKRALRGLSIALKPGECFGFLGVNGAGKSTAMAILTGDVAPTSGRAFVAGRPLSDPSIQLSIGYCPQTDPLLDLLTGEETLWFFGRIRGIPEKVLGRRIALLIEQVGLSQHAKRVCGNYSGGNKRKLSLAIALIGDPKILLLDEPSSGMDPEARRNMWTAIEQVSKNRSVVLTTHSMEECEALCSRIGIMVKGKLKCLGTSQHLKNRFGKGYEVELRCRNSGKVDDATALILQRFPCTEIQERYGDFVKLQVPRDIDLESLFCALEENKADFGILDYSVNQTSLEQIFVSFAGAEYDTHKSI